MVQEDQEDEEEAAEVNQVQPVMPAAGQLQSIPLTPPVAQGHVPAELLPPTQIPSIMALPFNPMLDSNLHHHLHLGHLQEISPTRALCSITTVSAINS